MPDHTAAVPLLGLRERKKQATRNALIQAALELFASRGVDAVSVHEISQQVGVSPRTFHRYFASKDDVLFADRDDQVARASEVLDRCPPEESLLDTLRVAMVDLVATVGTVRERERLRLQLIESSDRLRARNLRRSEEIADRLADHVARRLGPSADAAYPSLLAAWTLASVRVAHRRWLADPELELIAEVERAFELLGLLNSQGPGR